MTANGISEARMLFDAGERQKAFDRLHLELWDRGETSEVRAEIHRLFPITSDILAILKEFESHLSNTDGKIRQKAARQLSSMALSTSNKKSLETLRHAETIDLLVRHLQDEDPIIQEHMVIALAMTFKRYRRDRRAFEPLLAHLGNKKINTRGWAATGLLYLGDNAVDHVLPMIDDKAERVRESVFDELSMAIQGGGHFHRDPMGKEGRRKVRDAMLRVDRTNDANYRIAAASLLAATAEKEDLPALKDWQKKDGSKQVKVCLQAGIDRLEQSQ